jgi:biotin/methionine sulfoxide reductase
VFPATTSIERNDFGAGTQDNAIIPMPAAIAAMGEARDEYDIYCELERRLGLGEAFSLGRSSSDWLSEMWSDLTESAAEFDYVLPDFECFMKGDIISFHDPHPDAVFLQDFRSDPKKYPLETPTGKIMLASDTIKSFAYEDCPGYPQWLHKEEAHEHPLQLISGQPETRLHSQFDNGAFSRSKKIDGREPVLLNPLDAAARGIDDGDIIRLFNENGSCLAAAVLSDELKKGVVFLWTGAWYEPDFADPECRDNHGNPNVLTADKRASRLSQGPAVDISVDIEKFLGEAPPVRIFQPPLSDAQ